MNSETQTGGTAKTLATIPNEILYSTWRQDKGWAGRSYDAGKTFFRWVLALAGMAAMPLLPAQLILAVPFDSFIALVPTFRRWATAYFAAVLLLHVLLRVYELEGFVPRKDKEYPLYLARESAAADLLGKRRGWWGPNYTMLWFGITLLGFALFGWQDNPDRIHTIGYGLANLAFSGAGYLVSWRRPYFWYRKPTPQDELALKERLNAQFRAQIALKKAAQAQQARRQADAQPHVPPSTEARQQAVPDYATPVEVRLPRVRFEHIFGMQAIKDKLLAPAEAVLTPLPMGAEAPGNGILLHGEPGNGKTVFAEALAGELGIPFIPMTYGDVVSKWLGETPRVISNCFAFARQEAPCVLFIDEVDSFIRSRDAGSNNAEDLKITNILLTEIVNIRDEGVVLVAATNYLANLDAAAIREGRFDFKVEITAPDEAARVGLLQNGVKKYAQGLRVDQEAMLSVAKRWAGFSVSRLLAVAKALPEYARTNGKSVIGFDDWVATLRTVQGRKGQVPRESKTLQALVLEPDTREALELIAARLKDAYRIETMGGTLPSGILFHGPSGTGKTAAARALALECGWAFLPAAGPDLVADRDKLTKAYAEAKDLRPTLVFIDEADDVLRNRQFSNTPDVVNRLLVLMDGSEEQIKDVVFIAATNHPEQADPALLRAGRFTEKVEFFPPRADQVPQAISSWMKSKMVSFEHGMNAFEAADLLSGQTVANIEGVLQYALNRAISRCEARERAVVSREDLAAALRVVAGAGG